MQKAIITILMIMCWAIAYTQVDKSAVSRPVKSLLSTAKNKLNAVKDSVTTSTNKALQHLPGKSQVGRHCLRLIRWRLKRQPL